MAIPEKHKHQHATPEFEDEVQALICEEQNKLEQAHAMGYKIHMRKTNAPLQVGSLVRNTGFGSRLLVVTAINGEEVTAQSFGRTYHGDFKRSTRPVELRGRVYDYGTETGFRVYHRVTKTGLKIIGWNSWDYMHVVPAPSKD